MKKIISVALMLLIFVSSSVCVCGAEDESQEMKNVLIMIKQRIGETDGYDKFNSSVSSSENSVIYNFSWSSESSNLNIGATADGVIVSYYFNDNGDSSYKDERKPTINKLKSEEAKQIAEEFISSLNPGICDDLRIINNTTKESIYDSGYSFDIQRMHKGIDVIGDNGYIRLTAGAEKIEVFRLNYTQNIEFDQCENIIGENEAREKFKVGIGVDIRYNIDGENTHLEYFPVSRDDYICASDGSVINPTEVMHSVYKNESSVLMSPSLAGGASDAAVQLSEAELKNVAELNNLVSKAECENTLRNNELLGIKSDDILTHFNMQHNSAKNEYYYNYEFSSGEKYISVRVNAEDETIVQFSKYGGKYEEVTKTDEKKAEYFASVLAGKLFSSADSEYHLDFSEKGTYEFVRFVNNIKCPENTINISLDNDNNITYYSIYHTDVEFVSPDGIISENEAADMLFEHFGYNLYYYPSCSEEKMRYNDKAVLIYDFAENSPVIDAHTGKKSKLEQSIVVTGDYTDISGHYAENIIRELSLYGIGFADNEFRPDDVISTEEYIVLITSALVGNEGIVVSEKSAGYASYLYMAKHHGICNEIISGENVTREMAAVYMIRALGFDEVASLPDIYTCNFDDVTSSKGHIAILNAMGVVSGYNGKFHPDSLLTRADAMMMIYNYLNN